MRCNRSLAALAIALPSSAAMAGVSNSWITWNAPTSYDQSAQFAPWASYPNENYGNYNYANGATGTITMPDTSTVGVTFSGEILAPNSFNAQATSYWGTPTGFASVAGTTTSDYWSNRPTTDGDTFNSQNATAPTNGDHIGLCGSGTLTQTITFDAPVTNIVMAVFSLGSEYISGSWDFNQDFDILSDNTGVTTDGYAGSGLTRTEVGGAYRLTGSEGAGMIQFFGTFTELSWTVSAPEMSAAWNIGVTPVTAPSQNPAVPGIGGIAAIAGLGLAGRRRRR